MFKFLDKAHFAETKNISSFVTFPFVLMEIEILLKWFFIIFILCWYPNKHYNIHVGNNYSTETSSTSIVQFSYFCFIPITIRESCHLILHKIELTFGIVKLNSVLINRSIDCTLLALECSKRKNTQFVVSNLLFSASECPVTLKSFNNANDCLDLIFQFM